MTAATAAAAAPLTDAECAAWDKTGKNEFLRRVKNLAIMIPTSTLLESHDEVRRSVYALLESGASGKLKATQVAAAVGELVIAKAEMASLVMDLFNLVDQETQATSAGGKKDHRERFVSMYKECERYLPEATIKERAEIETLGETGIVKNHKKFFSTTIKLKTKLFYKQQKFNLFREESEGYAKLIAELNQDLTTVTPAEVLELIKSIIGYFNLDPNRVLDIILESFECQLDRHDFFVELLRLYRPDKDTLNDLLGFKYKHYMSPGVAASAEVPDDLFKQTSLLIQHGILDMESIYGMLGPDDEQIKADSEEEMKEARLFIRKLNSLNTAQKEDGDKDEQADQTKKPVNQKFGLLEALLRVGAWKEAEGLIMKLPTYFAVAQPNIADALQNLIHISLEPLHREHCGPTVGLRSRAYPPLRNKSAPKPAATFEEFRSTVMPMLLALGPYAHSDPILLYKILRILKASLGIAGKDDRCTCDPTTTPLYFDALTLMDEVFLPALSLSEANCCLAEELWTVLRVYPYHHRYRLYGMWKGETYTLHPALLRKKATMQKSVKRIMQRISKENVKPTSRQLGKLTHSSPGLIFEYILNQIQLYDNMILPVVDSFKYLTALSFDVLGYSIIEALYNPEKDRTKHDGTSISLWLTSLSNFCGAVFKKYQIELTGILQYVANQLKSKRSLDLIILKEMVLKMGGIEAAEEMTSEQIDAMAGGELLRQEAGSFTQIKNTRKSSQRLKDYLIDNNLAVPLCLLMAQQRNCVVYQETEDSHLKLVGKLSDQCQDTLVQFGAFLASNLSVDDYTRRLPPMKDLLTKYHVNLDLAFLLARPMFNHQISLKFDEMRRQEKVAWKNKTDAEKQEMYIRASQETMLPVTDAIRPLHPPKIWDDISPQFLTTFWSLTMYDLFTPDVIYAKEIAKLKAAPAKVDENKDLNPSRKKKEKERLNNLLDKLTDEQKRQREHVDKVMARLRAEKDSWFFSRNAKLAKNETITTFLQLCLFPRCIFTANDAIYCAKFVQVIHLLKTPNFSTLICFDRIFCDITYTVTACTENEAHRYGRFLAAMLEIVMRWHSSKDIFEKECVGYPGFVTKFRVATADKDKDKDKDKGDDHVDYENYRHVCHKWHYRIAKSLVVCLESKDYVQIRNALTILFKILPSFPVLQQLAAVVEKRIEKVCAEEKDQRKDLYVIATSYLGQLKNRKSQNQIMKENDFHQSKKGSSDGSKSDEKPAKEKSKDKDKESKSRSQSREKSVSKEDRKRSSESRERSSREKTPSSRTDMGPPSSHHSSRKSNSAEPRENSDSAERDSKRRKLDQDDRKSRERSVDDADGKRKHRHADESSSADSKRRKDVEQNGAESKSSSRSRSRK